MERNAKVAVNGDLNSIGRYIQTVSQTVLGAITLPTDRLNCPIKHK